MKAYLVVDMSNDFVADDGGLSVGKPAQAIVKNILARLDAFNRNGDIIAFCMDAHTNDDKHFDLWPKHCVIGTWGAQLYGEIFTWYESHKQSPKVLYIPKTEYDAFYHTNLGDILRSFKVDKVVVSGVCTDICVMNTVYGAYKEGFATVVNKSDVATFTPNGEVFLESMANFYHTKLE